MCPSHTEADVVLMWNFCFPLDFNTGVHFKIINESHSKETETRIWYLWVPNIRIFIRACYQALIDLG